MSIFNNVQTSNEVEEVEDRVGGGFTVYDTGVYFAQVIRAYGIVADSGALGFVLEANIFDDQDDLTKPKRFNTTQYVTDKNKNNFYENKEGKKFMNSGWLLADAVAVFATNGEAGLGELETEDFFIEKTKDSEKVQVKVELYPELAGIELNLGILKVNKPKQVKVDGVYKDVEGEFRLENELSQVFNADGFTLLEWEAEQEEPKFINAWEKQWKGKTKEVKPKVAATAKTGGGNRSRSAAAARPARTTTRPSRFTK